MNETASLSAAAMLQVLLSLGAVLLLIFALAWMVRRMPGLRGRSGVLELHGGLQLGAKERVVLVRAGDTWLLLGVTTGSVSPLHVFATPPQLDTPAQDAAPAAPPFAQRLAATLRRPQAE